MLENIFLHWAGETSFWKITELHMDLIIFQPSIAVRLYTVISA